MTIKSKLCEGIEEYFYSEGMTYDQGVTATGLTRSQLYNVLKNEGGSISIDRLEKVLDKIGLQVKLDIYRS
ncbi:putative DNA-binding domain protein [Vibrio phage 277E43-1]|nr:putative DNA-binding domain protein [Vibrio phage 277E43-1]